MEVKMLWVQVEKLSKGAKQKSGAKVVFGNGRVLFSPALRRCQKGGFGKNSSSWGWGSGDKKRGTENMYQVAGGGWWSRRGGGGGSLTPLTRVG